MATTASPQVSSAGQYSDSNYPPAFFIMTAPFFVWGFITALNDILIPHLKAAFSLSYTQAQLVQFCFFGAYFIASPFAGRIVERIGFQKGIVLGFSIVAAGCLLFYPAAEFARYTPFLMALFTLACGITVLQVSANPYASILGAPATAASRLNFAQAVNSAGHTVAPQFGAMLILGAAATAGAASADAVKLPYILIAGFALIAAAVFFFLKLPAISHDAVDGQSTGESIWQHKPLVLGALAIFLYVGAEVSIGGFLVNFFAEPHIGNLSEHEAGKMISYYWGAAMIGRLLGAFVMRFIAPFYVLACNGAIAIALIAVAVTSQGEVAMWSILAVGFFNSIMFPTIFAMAISGLGDLTSRGSGLLCQAIVGGAILPLIQGIVADAANVQVSFLVPAVCYLYIAWYALNRRKVALDNVL